MSEESYPQVCPKCGHKIIRQYPPLIYCVECGYLLTPLSPDVSPKPRAVKYDRPSKWFLWESNFEKKMLWGRRIDTFDKDFVMPKGTRKQVILFIIIMSIIIALVWYRLSRYPLPLW